MSIWSSALKNVGPSEFSDFPKKAYTKIDATAKLQVIQALDNGQCKADIAKEYGVHPQTIAYIYKQKDSIIKKYTQKYNLLKQVYSLNLDQNLLEWFEHQYTSGNIITENQLHSKAKDILKSLSEEFTCLDDLLFNFRTRHNISKYTSDNLCNEQAKGEWKKFLKRSDTSDVYVGGVCALSHSLDYNSFLNGQPIDSYVSLFFIVNTLGTDKLELAVVGNESLESETNVKSLPVNYYYSDNTQINNTIIESYLTKWDNELVSQGKSVTLMLNVPDNLIRTLHFDNITLISTSDMNYVINILENLVECFKYHFRRLQITRGLTYGKDNSTFLDYIHMMGMAWYSVPYKFVQSLSFPPEDGSLYFNINEDSENDHRISQWCRAYNLPLNLDEYSKIDKYIFCDNKLPCLNCGQLDDGTHKVTEVLPTQQMSQAMSGMEAYQAMKRLVSYLQGESAGGSVMKYAKYLENHLEYGALLQMHQIIASSNDTI